MDSKDERYQYLHDWRMDAQSEDPDYLRRKALKELYHMTVEEYEARLFEQGSHCALCEETQQSTNSNKRLSVDHDHGCCPGKRACGKCNRGLLCFNCNKKLGSLEIFMRDCTTFNIVPSPGTWTTLALAYLDNYKIRAAVTTIEKMDVTPMYPPEDHRGMHPYPAVFGPPADTSRTASGSEFTFPNRPLVDTKKRLFDGDLQYHEVETYKF